jgi:hypothetical protein
MRLVVEGSMMDFVAWAGISYAGVLGMVAAVVTTAVLAARRALEGRNGIEFADLATAAIVGIAVGLVPLVGQLLAIRAYRKQGWGQDMGMSTEIQDTGRPTTIGDDHFARFTDGARKVLTLSQDESQRLDHNYLGTEHLLLGLLREEEGTAAQALRNLGMDLEKVRIAVEFIIGHGDHAVIGEVGLTPRAKRVIELAIDEARRLGHDHIGTEHLLLGLVREGEGIAAGVLESLGVGLDKTRAEVIRLVSTQSAED